MFLLAVSGVVYTLFTSIRKEAESREKIFWNLLGSSALFLWLEKAIDTLIFLSGTETTAFLRLHHIFHLLHPLAILLAVIFLVHQKQRPVNKWMTLIDIMITLLVIGTLSWHFLMEPLSGDSGLSLPARLFLFFNPLLDLLVLFGLFHALFLLEIKTLSPVSIRTLALAVTFRLMADLCLLFSALKQNRGMDGIADILVSLSLYFTGLSGLFRDKGVRQGHRFHLVKKYVSPNMLHLASIFTMSLLFIPYIARINLLLISVIACFFLLLARQFLMLREIRILNRLLTQATEQLEEKNDKLKKTVAELERLNFVREIEAKTDFLTGLFNRRHMELVMKASIAETSRSGKAFSIMLVDLDHFKTVNDRFGHNIGDQVLIHFARFLSESTRPIDWISRFGGEEFLILLPDTETEEAVRLAEGLRLKIEQHPIDCGPVHLSVTISIGVTAWKAGDTFESLYQRVDDALYEAKKERNTVVARD